MFGITKEMSITLITSLVNVSCHTKCLSLSNQKCEIQPIFINWHPNEYRQELHCYPFAVKLDRCVGSCNTFNELFKKVCAPNEMLLIWLYAGINESKILTKCISCNVNLIWWKKM